MYDIMSTLLQFGYEMIIHTRKYDRIAAHSESAMFVFRVMKPYYVIVRARNGREQQLLY